MRAKAKEDDRGAPNVRHGCICFNQSRPDAEGCRRIDPCCRIHYAERIFLTEATDPAAMLSEMEAKDWRSREQKRVTYPKMTVARS